MVKLALLIGENSPRASQPGEENSIVALKQVLQHPGIGYFTEVRILDNPQPLAIQQAIETLFSDRQPNDLVMLYFSGQLIQDERGKLYLTTRTTRKDAQGKLVKSTAVSAAFLEDVMNDSHSLQQVVIFDCLSIKNSSNGLTQNPSVPVEQLSGPGRVILTALTSIQNDKSSYPSSYADYLVEALRTGAADLNDDGLVFLDELYESTCRKVQRVAPATELRIYPPRRNQILLAKVPDSNLSLRHQAVLASSLGPQLHEARTPILSTRNVHLASRMPPPATTTAATLIADSPPAATRPLLLRITGIAALVLALAGIIYSLARQWQDIHQLNKVRALAAQKDYEQCLAQVQKLPERLSRKSATGELLMQCQSGATWQSPQVHALMGHSDWVWSIAPSPNGQALASGSRDKTIKLWDLPTGSLVRTLTGHTSDVFSVAISPDGRTLASGSNDKTIKLWDIKTGELLRTLAGHSHEVWSVAISPDGRTLASGSNDKTIKLWDIKTGELLRTLAGHRSDILSVAFTPNGQTLASGSKDRTIRLWDLSTGNSLHTLVGHTDSLRAVAFSPDGQTLASGSWDKTIKIWQLPTGTLLHTINAHDRYVNTIAYAPWSDANSPQGQVLASGSDDATVKLWNPLTGELLRTLRVHAGHINSVTFMPHRAVPPGRTQNSRATLASGSQDTTIKVVQRN